MTFLSLVVELKKLHKTTVAKETMILEGVAQYLGLDEESIERFVATVKFSSLKAPRAYVLTRMLSTPSAIRWIVTA